MNINYHVSTAVHADAQEILELQKLAFALEARRYNNFDIPPLQQTIEELENQFRDHVILKAVSNGRIIGTVRAHEKDDTCFIGRLAVHPDVQNNGIGTALMEYIEGCFMSRRYELFAGSKSDNVIRLYEKLGYVIYKTDCYECGEISIHYMEKKAEGAPKNHVYGTGE